MRSASPLPFGRLRRLGRDSVTIPKRRLRQAAIVRAVCNATLACVHEPGKNWWVGARANPEGLLYRLADLYRLRVSLLGGRAHGRRVHELGPGGVWHAHDTGAVDAWLASGRIHD